MQNIELRDRILAALSGVTDPEIRRPITDLGMVPEVSTTSLGEATVLVNLTILGCPAANKIENDVRTALDSVAGLNSYDLTMGVMSPEERADFVARVRGNGSKRKMQFGEDSLTRVIAVTSGKGGVGKSTVTANLAVALSQRGLSVGIVDADIFGFSIPAILGLTKDGRTASPTRVNDMILAPVAHGVSAISIGMFLGEEDARDTAVSWRGPMLHRTVEQFLTDVWFGNLDVLLLDLPPGTGDVAITLGQLLPHAEVLVVTTPQVSASDVAVRSGILALNTGQKILGVVENMAAMTLPDGTVMNIFGGGGAEEVAARLSDSDKNKSGSKVDVLASLPISVPLRETSDGGTPIIISDPEDPAALEFLRLADAVIERRPSLQGVKLPVSKKN